MLGSDKKVMLGRIPCYHSNTLQNVGVSRISQVNRIHAVFVICVKPHDLSFQFLTPEFYRNDYGEHLSVRDGSCVS